MSIHPNRPGWLGRTRLQSDDRTVTPRQLAQELGHDDCGRAIHAFLRHPDDGRGPFSGHRLITPWHLAPDEADRVRERFAF